MCQFVVGSKIFNNHILYIKVSTSRNLLLFLIPLSLNQITFLVFDFMLNLFLILFFNIINYETHSLPLFFELIIFKFSGTKVRTWEKLEGK